MANTARRFSFQEEFAHRLVSTLFEDELVAEIQCKTIFAKFKERGILPTDPRLQTLHQDLDDLHVVTRDKLFEIIPRNLEMFKKLGSQKLAIPNFTDFKHRITSIYERVKPNQQGKVATYIPQIAKANPDHFAVSICTIDGQQLHLGECDHDFSIQSCSKIINYCIALEQHGEDIVHRYVGKEPSGVEFNAITLDKHSLPHNPCTNAGAIMVCSLMGRDTMELDYYSRDSEQQNEQKNSETESSVHASPTHPSISRQASATTTSLPFQTTVFEVDRFELVSKIWNRLFAGNKVLFSNAVYLSERATGHRNWALGHFLCEQKPGFPPHTHLKGVMEFYFQCCSLEATTRKLSLAAAALANGGVHPLTGDYIFKPETVRDCLSVMWMCGMYDYSGEFAFKIGIPSKSGVSGAIISIVPKVMGICVFSPPLDSYGNSVRGVAFLAELSEQFPFHSLDNAKMIEHTKKIDPTQSFTHYNGQCNIKRTQSEGSIASSMLSLNEDSRNTQLTVFKIMSYSASGDLPALQRMYFRGCDLDVSDYDFRTPLHLAASCGHLGIVKFLCERYKDMDIAAMKDRWNGTPLDDAEREGYPEIVQYLKTKMIH